MLLERAKVSFGAFRKARSDVKQVADISMKAISWKLAINEYCKTTKFLSETARALGRNTWADALLLEQKQSPVLSYLFHARNADNHGLHEVTENLPAALNIGRMFSFVGNTNITIENCYEIVTMPDGSKLQRSVSGNFSTMDGMVIDGWLKSEVPVSTTPKHLSIRSVSDRGVTYNTPACGVEPDCLANELLQRADNWLDGKIKALTKSK